MRQEVKPQPCYLTEYKIQRVGKRLASCPPADNVFSLILEYMFYYVKSELLNSRPFSYSYNDPAVFYQSAPVHNAGSCAAW